MAPALHTHLEFESHAFGKALQFHPLAYFRPSLQPGGSMAPALHTHLEFESHAFGKALQFHPLAYFRPSLQPGGSMAPALHTHFGGVYNLAITRQKSFQTFNIASHVRYTLAHLLFIAILIAAILYLK